MLSLALSALNSSPLVKVMPSRRLTRTVVGLICSHSVPKRGSNSVPSAEYSNSFSTICSEMVTSACTVELVGSRLRGSADTPIVSASACADAFGELVVEHPVRTSADATPSAMPVRRMRLHEPPIFFCMCFSCCWGRCKGTWRCLRKVVPVSNTGLHHHSDVLVRMRKKAHVIERVSLDHDEVSKESGGNLAEFCLGTEQASSRGRCSLQHALRRLEGGSQRELRRLEVVHRPEHVGAVDDVNSSAVGNLHSTLCPVQHVRERPVRVLRYTMLCAFARHRVV